MLEFSFGIKVDNTTIGTQIIDHIVYMSWTKPERISHIGKLLIPQCIDFVGFVGLYCFLFINKGILISKNSNNNL